MAERVPEYKPKADAPPKDKRESRKREPSSRLSSDRAFKHTIPELREALENLFGFLILGLQTRGIASENEAMLKDAEVLADSSGELIESWIWLAQKHNGVRRGLEYLCGGGGYMTFITANLAVALPIAQNHGLYPENWPTPGSLNSIISSLSMNGNGETSGEPETETSPN